MAWTDERVELLKKLWAEGLSASQIAGRLGGVTRNAVIGKVHRLGLSGRATTVRSKAPRPRRKAGAPASNRPVLGTQGNTALKPFYAPEAEEDLAASPAPIEELVIPPSERASILTLKESTCRWPIGDPGDEDFHFCGRKAEQGVPYCPYHCRIAYQPANTRRKDRQRASGGR
ncbi:MAG: GcrA family cell cycle regulator [Methyloligellaceae bacterium]|nr:MAG: GcrA cell cycle regulator [Alphaproteobacteria bacterium]